jgi:DNA-binding CsgD family transcriptional regulator
MLERKCGLSLRNAVLAAATEPLTRTLHGLTAAAGAPNGERTSGAMALPRPGHCRPLSVIVSPVRPDRLSVFCGSPAVLVSVCDPDGGASVSELRIRDVLGLTRTEARVALKLLEGRETHETAEALGVSFYTVRAHLARIFGKTGTQRQAELVALLTRLSGHLRAMD